MNNFTLRILSGTVYVALIVGGLWFTNPVLSPINWFALLMALFIMLAITEMINLTQEEAGSSTRLTAIVYGGLVVYLALFEQLDPLKLEYIGAFAVQLISLFFMYWHMKQGKKPALLFGTMYLWMPLAALALWMTQNQTESGYAQLLFLFVVIWAYDSFAYLVGKGIGKTPIFPKVSPKKTYEGTIGGIMLAISLAYALNHFFLNLSGPVILYAFVIIVAGILGDFFESYLKRKLEVKDSGTLIPGHGGILDRLDSVLFAALPYIILLSLS